MSDKVKLTKEQAIVIGEHLDNSGSKEDAVEQHIRGWSFKDTKCLNELTLDEFIHALYIGYEVELEYKVGDWVVTGRNVIGVYGKDIMTSGNIRHATESEIAEEKERRWWSCHGRKVNEYKPSDIVSASSSSLLCLEVIDIDCDGDVRLQQHDETIFLRKPEKLTVICFAEDRLDWRNQNE